MTSISDPKLVVKDLLEQEWQAENTPESSPPRIFTGWPDEDMAGPSVTVGPDEESPTSDTGFTGIKPDGSGPTSERRGTVTVNTWAERPTSEANPKQTTFAFRQEIERILDKYGHEIASYSGWSINGVDADDLRYISWLGAEYMPDTRDAEAVPIRHRYLCTLGYEYLNEPE